MTTFADWALAKRRQEDAGTPTCDTQGCLQRATREIWCTKGPPCLNGPWRVRACPTHFPEQYEIYRVGGPDSQLEVRDMKMEEGIVLSPEEFLTKARTKAEDPDDDDPESTHVDHDRLMAEVLESLGYGEGIKYIMGLKRWYA